jgi:hypothetical protein
MMRQTILLQLLRRKYGYMKAGAYGLPTQAIKTRPFLDVSRNSWVPDATSYRVGRIYRFYPRVSRIFRLSNLSLHTFNYFVTRSVKTALHKAAWGEKVLD